MFCCGFANGSVVSFFCITSRTLCLPKRMSQIDERAVCFSVLAAIFMFCVAFKTSRSVLMALEWMNASGAPHALLWVLGPAKSMWLCCESLLWKGFASHFFVLVYVTKSNWTMHFGAVPYRNDWAILGRICFRSQQAGLYLWLCDFGDFCTAWAKGVGLGRKKSVINLVSHFAYSDVLSCAYFARGGEKALMRISRTVPFNVWNFRN